MLAFYKRYFLLIFLLSFLLMPTVRANDYTISEVFVDDVFDYATLYTTTPFSFTVDSDGVPQFAYMFKTENEFGTSDLDLFYLKGTDKAIKEKLDIDFVIGNPYLLRDSNDNPIIIYFYKTSSSSQNNIGYIKYVDGEWVNYKQEIGGEYFNTFPIIDDSGTVHFLLQSLDFFGNDDIKYVQLDESGIQIHDTGIIGFISKKSLKIDSNGIPHFVYHTDDLEDIVYSYMQKNEWYNETVISSNDGMLIGDIFLNIDSNDVPHILYSKSNINYYEVLSNLSDQRTETVTQVVMHHKKTNGKWNLSVYSLNDDFLIIKDTSIDSSNRLNMLYVEISNFTQIFDLEGIADLKQTLVYSILSEGSMDDIILSPVSLGEKVSHSHIYIDGDDIHVAYLIGSLDSSDMQLKYLQVEKVSFVEKKILNLLGKLDLQTINLLIFYTYSIIIILGSAIISILGIRKHYMDSDLSVEIPDRNIAPILVKIVTLVYYSRSAIAVTIGVSIILMTMFLKTFGVTFVNILQNTFLQNTSNFIIEIFINLAFSLLSGVLVQLFPIISFSIAFIILSYGMITFLLGRSLSGRKNWARIILIISSLMGIASWSVLMSSGLDIINITNLVISCFIFGSLVFSRKVKNYYRKVYM